MSASPCSVDGCGRAVVCRGFCDPHYKRWHRHGDPGPAEILTRRADCSVPGCARPHFGQGYCKTHNYRFRENGDPLRTRRPGAKPGERNHQWLGDAVEYAAVHRRLQVDRGPATEHPCIDCGGAASDWAYQHSDPAERRCPTTGLLYTTDLQHYAPMCRSCHLRLDARRRLGLDDWQTRDRTVL
jgi:hypothetical protein